MVDGVINTVFFNKKHTTLYLKTERQTSKQCHNKATATWIPNEASEKKTTRYFQLHQAHVTFIQWTANRQSDYTTNTS